MFVIAGFGHVGSAIFEVFAKHYNVAAVDPKINPEITIKDYPQAQGVIVCVPTPSDNDGYDTQYLRQVLDEVPRGMPILIKSTVSPYVVDELFRTYPHHDITYAPEYLTEANAVVDFACQEIAHMGGSNVEFWTKVWKTIIPFCAVKEVDARTVVFQKMIRNAFLATKVIWFNELFRMCKSNLIDYNSVVECLKDDHRIGDSHMQVPGPDGLFGYGGTCFPKEVEAVLHMADSEHTLLEQVKRINDKIRP